MSTTNTIPLDSIVKAIIDKFQTRAEMGWKKYGTTLDRQDLSPVDWIQHAQEELMDGILYLEKLKQTTVTGTDHPQSHQSPSCEIPSSLAAPQTSVSQ